MGSYEPMITQDAGFTYLLGRHPDEALVLFCPEALAARGAPADATLVATEIPPLTSDSSHRLMDLAVRFTWPDHAPLIITLLEHGSDRHRIDLHRVLRSMAELIQRHPTATVLPIILVTDHWPSQRPEPSLTHANRITRIDAEPPRSPGPRPVRSPSPIPA